MTNEGARPPLTRGSLVTLAVLIAAAAAGFGYMAKQSRDRARAEEALRPAVVSLGGTFVRTLEGGERFEASIALELDPAVENRGRLIAEIESRRTALRSIVIDEVLGRAREEDFRRGQAFVETLRLLVQDRLNRELQAAGLGAAAIRRVIFEDVVAPAAAR